jgi:hypothetical protein
MTHKSAMHRRRPLRKRSVFVRKQRGSGVDVLRADGGRQAAVAPSRDLSAIRLFHRLGRRSG